MLVRYVFLALLISLLSSCRSARDTAERQEIPVPDSIRYPKLAFTIPAPLSWVDTTLAAMTLEQKVGQLIMARMFGHYISLDGDEYERLARLVRDQHIGGIAVFQGDIYGTAVLLNNLQRLARVPLVVAADFERGVAMRLRRGTYFPDAMALGATYNPELAYRVGRAVAEEARAIGVHWNFAPVADVNNNPANPVINTRSFGEDLPLVSRMVNAFARGLSEGGVVSTVKHFPGHGDTGVDSHIDLPVLPFTRARLDSLELVPFKRAIDDGVMSVMVAHVAIPALEPDKAIPSTLSERVITRTLKGELGFQGLVVTDAMEMAGLMRGFSIGDAAVKSLQAGVDIVLMPSNEQVAIDAIVGAVRSGALSESRIEESVRKILMVKQWLQLDENRFVDIDRIGEFVATRKHRALAKQAAREAITVVRNEQNVLPLQQHGRKKMVAVIISDTDDNRTEINRPANQYPNEPFGAYFSQLVRRRYGNIETHRLTPSSNRQTLDSVLTRIRRADVVLVPLYIKVRSASGKVGIPENVLPFVARMDSLNRPTVVIAYGNPYVIGAFPRAAGLMCAYTDAEVMVEASVEALFGEIEVFGRLPVSIPGVYPRGAGVRFAQSYLRVDDPSFAGFDPKRLAELDDIILSAIHDSTFPGAQLVVVKDEIIVYNKAFGTYTYDPASQQVDEATLFDLASLTKVVATTASVMKLYDQQKLALDDSIGKYIPCFGTAAKSGITIRHLLQHRSGLPAHRAFWTIAPNPPAAFDSMCTTPLVAAPGDSTIYSDLGMIVLGKVVEQVAGMSLAEYASQEFYQPLRMVSTVFNPSKAMRPFIAPTEVDTLWRNGLVQGTVHDENAWFFGGVAGHAGLFSNATDLAVFTQMLINGGTYGGVRYLADSTVKTFTQRTGQRALGWDVRSATGSSAGSLFSLSSYGHTGFTGTSVWVDPERSLAVVLLTNRVHPVRSNTRILSLRPRVHDAVIRALVSTQPARKPSGGVPGSVRGQ